MAVAAPTTDSAYPALFRSYVLRSITYLLEELASPPTRLSAEEQAQVIHTLEYALRLPEAGDTTRRFLLKLTPIMEQAGYRDEWIPYLEWGIEQSQQVADEETEAELRYYLGILLQYLAQYEAAKEHLERSDRLFDREEWRVRQGRTLNRLASVVRRQGHLDAAQQLATRALALVSESTDEQAYSRLMLGLVAFERRDWDSAAHKLEISLALWSRSSNQRMIGWGLSNLGIIKRVLQDYEGAIDHYQRAIAIFDAIEDSVHLATARVNLGNTYLMRDRPSEALSLYRLAEPVFRRTLDKARLATLHINQGMAYYRLGDWGHARRAYEFSIEQWYQLGSLGDVVNVMDGLGLVYHDQGQQAKAIATFQKALALLAQIPTHPAYNHLRATLQGHLQAAQAPATHPT